VGSNDSQTLGIAAVATLVVSSTTVPAIDLDANLESMAVANLVLLASSKVAVVFLGSPNVPTILGSNHDQNHLLLVSPHSSQTMSTANQSLCPRILVRFLLLPSGLSAH
jgi:hypothetical protein